MKLGLVAALGATLGCGGPNHHTSDGGADTPDADSGDAMPHGTLTPEPPDPKGLPCSGTLGFPGVPVVWLRDTAASVLVGDLDGDGKPDLVGASSAYVETALGHGDGTFDAPVTVSSNVEPHSLQLVDVNGDARLDLVYSPGNQANVYVQLGSGNGTFAAAQLYNAGFNLEAVIAQDLNGDGRVDLAAFNLVQVSVRLNSATGFGPASTYTVAVASGRAWGMADLTGDNRPDIVVVDGAGDKLDASINNGAGAFGTVVQYPGMLGEETIAFGDVNEDGKRDVILTGLLDNVTGAVGVLLNQGGGALGGATSFASGDAASRHLVVADIDGDGHLDAAAASAADTQMTILRGTGQGTFGVAQQYVNDGGPRGLTLADVNRDGRPDLLTATLSKVDTYLNDGTSAMFEQRAELWLTGDYAGGARLVDLDADGTLELAVVEAGSAKLSTRVAAPPFAPTASEYMLGAGPNLLRADLDNDGHLDLVAVSSHGNAQGLLNLGTGTLVVQPVTTTSEIKAIAVGDVDGDGWRDLVIADPQQPINRVVYQHGYGTGSFGPPVPIWSHSGVAGVGVGDLDMDGQLDVLVSYDDDANGASHIDVLRGVGNGGFTLAAVINDAPIAPTGMLVRDVNGDAKPDILEYGNRFGTVLGNGNGTFNAPSTSLDGSANDTAVADLDGDGALDVVSLVPNVETIVVWRGRGDGTFYPAHYYDAGAVRNTVSIADVNGDGRLDIVVDNLAAAVLYGRCL